MNNGCHDAGGHPGKARPHSDVWRADTSGEQRTDLSELDDLLGQLDEMEPETPAATERIDELRGRIEILMDEIEITLGRKTILLLGIA